MSARLTLDAQPTLWIEDAEGKEHAYLIAPAPEGFDEWACLLERAGAPGHGPYRVARPCGSGKWRCSCKDQEHHRRRSRTRGTGPCKHIEAVVPLYALMRRLMLPVAPSQHQEPDHAA